MYNDKHQPIPIEGTATKTATVSTTFIGNEYPVVYQKYPSPSFNNTTNMITVPAGFVNDVVAIVDQNGSVIVQGIPTEPFHFTAPFPTSIGWIDSRNIVSQLTQVMTDDVVTPVVVTTTYSSTTKIVTITPNVPLPDGSVVFFNGEQAQQVLGGNSFTITLTAALADGVYIPSVVIPDDTYTISFVGLSVGNGGGANTESNVTMFFSVLVSFLFGAVVLSVVTPSPALALVFVIFLVVVTSAMLIVFS